MYWLFLLIKLTNTSSSVASSAKSASNFLLVYAVKVYSSSVETTLPVVALIHALNSEPSSGTALRVISSPCAKDSEPLTGLLS